MTEIVCFLPGQIIAIGNGLFLGEVLTTSINADGVRYQVGYWFKDEWKEVWIPASQVHRSGEPGGVSDGPLRVVKGFSS